MRAVVQRVSEASVSINGQVVGEIQQGYLILVGIHEEDTQEDVNYLAGKIAKLRVFEDQSGKMNQSIATIGGSILSVSQFTLYAETKKGNRPSFIKAARPETAIPLYEAFNAALSQEQIPVVTGEFGANMQVASINDGPVTIIFDTREGIK